MTSQHGHGDLYSLFFFFPFPDFPQADPPPNSLPRNPLARACLLLCRLRTHRRSATPRPFGVSKASLSPYETALAPMGRVEKQHLRCPEARGQQESEALPERGQTGPRDPMAGHKSEGRGSSGFDRLPATARPLRCLASLVRPSYRLVPCCRRRTHCQAARQTPVARTEEPMEMSMSIFWAVLTNYPRDICFSPLMSAHSRRFHFSYY